MYICNLTLASLLASPECRRLQLRSGKADRGLSLSHEQCAVAQHIEGVSQRGDSVGIDGGR